LGMWGEGKKQILAFQKSSDEVVNEKCEPENRKKVLGKAALK